MGGINPEKTLHLYSKQQATQLKQDFWTAFGQYMQPVPSVDGTKVNWSNYKTGARQIFFRMRAEKTFVSIAIELTDPSEEIRAQRFAQLLQLQAMLHNSLGEEWDWVLQSMDEHGKKISRVYKELQGVNVLNRADWPRIISFLKPRIIALDAFWNDARYGFE
jgi:hypothetical protein